MMPRTIPYKGYCWSFGTTSFRMKDFNRRIEEQLKLLVKFWAEEEQNNAVWAGNEELQSRYYDFLRAHEFIKGAAPNKPKDAREKTSGLVDLGLIDAQRQLTPVGEKLFAMSCANDYASDNPFQIPKDSFLYLKQMLKTSCTVGEAPVRPFIVLLYALVELEYLTKEEYTYLLPLCIDAQSTDEVIDGIRELRAGEMTVDDIIMRRLLAMDNYKEALELFLAVDVTEELCCTIGMNRKSRAYDRPYFSLYQELRRVFLERDDTALTALYKATKKIKIGGLWRSYLFSAPTERVFQKNPRAYCNRTAFDAVRVEDDLRRVFFGLMHLFKAKATLADYLDLNRRYIKNTDIVLFEDDELRFDLIPKYFFAEVMEELCPLAYTASDLLAADCALEDIAPCLHPDEQILLHGVNAAFGTKISDLADARELLQRKRHERLQKLIQTRFPNEMLLHLLSCFEDRNDGNDGEIRKCVTDNADVPTIFEYILGILWYRVSEFEGKPLDYMNLSLDADLLPKTHAAGGEADIVYRYAACSDYPSHALLLEATLSSGTNQRRMEMEPVSRHLGQYLLKHEELTSYCIFVTNELNINVLSDFRGRKSILYYDVQNVARYVSGMKIIPIRTAELRAILQKGMTYRQLYPLFEASFQSELLPHEWYEQMIEEPLRNESRSV